jgi:trans-aconitate methyltransferase
VKFRSEAQIQVSISTAYMREPELLQAARTYLEGRFPELNILSFGCSIGDELDSLKTIFPDAHVRGCDINPLALEVATRTTAGFAEVFYSDDDAITQRAPYHLICAFSSLCINPSPPDLPERYPFSRFESVIDLFVRSLAPGGMLALFNTSYILGDTGSAAKLYIYRPDTVHRSGWVDVYTPAGERVLRAKPTLASYAQVVESAHGIDDWDLIDCLFIRRPDDAAGAREVVPVSMFDPQDQLEPVLMTEWERSDLDSVPPEEQEGYLDFRRHFRLFRGKAAENGRSPVLLEQEVWRDSLRGEPIHVGTTGRGIVG